MPSTVFLAGATGAIGRRLVPQLLSAGHRVVGTTRSSERAAALRALGAEAVCVDVCDAAALARAVGAATPEIVVHQLTDLSGAMDLARNAAIRRAGTAHLVAAAIAAGARRLIAQSIAWAYAPGPEPHHEDDPLDLAATGTRAISVGGVVALETAVLAAPLSAVVLRYGQLYGPGTGRDAAAGAMPLHVDAAANAVLRAIGASVDGIFNVAEPNAAVATGRARDVLGWDAGFRLD